jgi:hypothetical protein
MGLNIQKILCSASRKRGVGGSSGVVVSKHFGARKCVHVFTLYASSFVGKTLGLGGYASKDP